MDVDGGGTDGAVPHQFLQGEQVGPVLVMVGGKGVAERVAGEAVLPPQFLFVREYEVGDALVVDWLGNVPLLREEEVPRAFPGGKRVPVLQDDPPCPFGKLRVLGRTVLGGAHQDPAPGMLDVRAFQMPCLADAQAGRKHQAEQRLEFQVGNGGKKDPHFLPGRDEGQVGIKLPQGELRGIPGLVQDVDCKEAELRDAAVYGAVGKPPGLLEPADEAAEFFP